MQGLLGALQGFVVIGIVIAAGYLAARFRIGGPSAQVVLNKFSFFICNPCLMFAILAKQPLGAVFNQSILVALFSALAVSIVFVILNRTVFHMHAAEETVGVLSSMYLNSNNIGLPVATYIVGNPAIVAPILVMQQILFTPVGLTMLDAQTRGMRRSRTNRIDSKTGKLGVKGILKLIAVQPLHQPLLIGSVLGIVISAIAGSIGWFPVPSFIFDPLNMIGQAAVPMMLMAFGMALKGSRPFARDANHRQEFSVLITAGLKNIVMPVAAFLIAYFIFGFRGMPLYAATVMAALPTGQNVYNFASQYEVGTAFARDTSLWSTMTAPIFIAIIAAVLG
jgi:predicted permease